MLELRYLREERGLTVWEIQAYFGFEEPSVIYMWQRGQNLPSVDNLCALSKLFEVSMEDVLVLRGSNDGDEVRSIVVANKQQKHIKKMLLFMAA